MSESERDTHPTAGDLATRTPPEGEPALTDGDGAPPAADGGGDRRTRAGAHADGNGNGTTAAPAADDGVAPIPPDGAVAPDAADGPVAPDPGDDPYAHHALDPEPEAPRRRRLRRRRRGQPAPAPAPPEPETEPDEGNRAPVIPLDRGTRIEEDEEPRPVRVRIRKLRLLAVLIGLSFLAFISTVFGMLMAVTSDLPQLEVQSGQNSVLVDRNGEPLGMLTGNQKRIFLQSNEIAPVMKQAIIAIEDRRFYTNAGIDLRGIGRALWSDVRAQGAVQGGSTITMQFVKNALAAQDERTIFNKLREAALAYQITRKWSKERILRNYLNTIYFGNGAYGIEAAAQTYFGSNHPGCGEEGNRKCAAVLTAAEAALLAGMVASPSGYEPLQNRAAAGRRRALVLQRMREQGYITAADEQEALETSLPTRTDIRPPVEDTAYPYFTSWVKQQVVDKLGGGQEGARKAFEGGLTVQTTLDVRLQEAAQQAVDAWLPYEGGPRASLVAVDNRTSEVLAMVGGDDYHTRPFNLATQGQRQPGSSFKPFVLAQALSEGVSPDSTWNSQPVDICVTRSKSGKCKEYFDVNNYEDAYGGIRTLRTATTFSDNSVYAQLGVRTGTKKIAHLARRMGVRTPVSHNFAMTLGGLKQGVTPLDMAHAYETFAQNGRFTYSTMSPGAVDRKQLGLPTPGPAGIKAISHREDGKLKPIELPDGTKAVGEPVDWPVLKSSVADEVSSMLSTVVSQGTATRAQIPGTFVAGKTGTTENYGDAWFVGWTDKITVAVWVGYPDELRPMETEFAGQPVAGGTYPASIWKTFVERAIALPEYGAEEEDEEDAATLPSSGAAQPTGTTAPSTGDGTAEATPAPTDGTQTTPAPETQAAPVDPEPEAPTDEAPPPTGEAPTTPQPPAQQPSTGGTGGASPP